MQARDLMSDSSESTLLSPLVDNEQALKNDLTQSFLGHTNNPSVNHETSFLIDILVNRINRLMALFENVYTPPASIFHSCKKPSISLQHYLQRFPQYGSFITPTSIMLMVIYLDKYISSHGYGKSHFFVNAFTIHRVCATALLIAHKYLEDKHVTNKIFAEFSGISLHELNKLELAFAKALDFSFYVSQDTLAQYKQALEKSPDFFDLATKHWPEKLPKATETFLDFSAYKDQQLTEKKQTSPDSSLSSDNVSALSNRMKHVTFRP